MKCYDPRDPRQSPYDIGSWKETENPALIIAHVVSSSGIDWPWSDTQIVNQVIMQADYCDELVESKRD